MTNEKALEVRVEQKLGLLNWNFEELNLQLDEQLEKYRGLTFTNEQMADAKKTRAALNKVAKEINDRKIAVKREFCAPYEQFESQAKILIDKIKSVSGEIDAQIKDYETNVKDEKKARIRAWWDENGKKNIDFEMIFNPAWLNTTCPDQRWQSDLEAICARTTNELYLLTMRSQNENMDVNFLIEEYMKTLSVQKSIEAWEEHLRAEERAKAERERIEQENLRRAEERAAQQAESKPEPAPEQEAEPEDNPRNYLYSPTFKLIDMTFDQAMELTQYLKLNGIQFKSLAKEKRRK